MIHIYTGDGKGKTTASLGLIIRALGSDMKVLFVQFLKGMDTGETKSLEKFENLTHIKDITLKKFTFQMTKDELLEVKQIHDKNLDFIIENAKKYDLIVLDEVISTINLQLIDAQKLIKFISKKEQEIVLTGREPLQELIDLADYVSEIKAVKHPYNQGINARKGIEF